MDSKEKISDNRLKIASILDSPNKVLEGVVDDRGSEFSTEDNDRCSVNEDDYSGHENPQPRKKHLSIQALCNAEDTEIPMVGMPKSASGTLIATYFMS